MVHSFYMDLLLKSAHECHEDILLDSFDGFLPGLREGAKAYLTA